MSECAHLVALGHQLVGRDLDPLRGELVDARSPPSTFQRRGRRRRPGIRRSVPRARRTRRGCDRRPRRSRRSAVGVTRLDDRVDGGVRRRGRRAGTARLDDRRAALLHGRDEVAPQPVLVADDVGRRLAADRRVREVRELGGRVVAPDGEVLDVAPPARRPSSPAGSRRGSGRDASSRTSGPRGPRGRWSARSGSWCCRGCRRRGRARRSRRSRRWLGPGA